MRGLAIFKSEQKAIEVEKEERVEGLKEEQGFFFLVSDLVRKRENPRVID